MCPAEAPKNLERDYKLGIFGCTIKTIPRYYNGGPTYYKTLDFFEGAAGAKSFEGMGSGVCGIDSIEKKSSVIIRPWIFYSRPKSENPKKHRA